MQSGNADWIISQYLTTQRPLWKVVVSVPKKYSKIWNSEIINTNKISIHRYGYHIGQISGMYILFHLSAIFNYEIYLYLVASDEWTINDIFNSMPSFFLHSSFFCLCWPIYIKMVINTYSFIAIACWTWNVFNLCACRMAMCLEWLSVY